MMEDKINAALVGLTAPHSKGWLQTLQHSPRIGRLALCDSECDSEADDNGAANDGATTQNPAGAAALYRDIDSLLDGEKLDFALVSLPNDEEAAAAEKLLRAGVPCIVEKPAGRTAADIESLNRAAADTGTVWATAFLNRYAPVACEFKRIVDAGALGKITSIEARMVTSTVGQRNPGHWLFAKERAGGGILHWLAIHSIDLIRYISGLEFSSVAAHIATLSGEEIDVEDMAAVSARMDNGALASLHAGYVLTRRYGDIYLAIRGTRGEAVWDMWNFEGRGDRLNVFSDAPGWDGSDLVQINAPARQAPGYGGAAGLRYLSDFIDACRNKTPFAPDGVDALRAMQLVEAAYAADKSGKTILLEGKA
jgi:predicted dehydrogenase